MKRILSVMLIALLACSTAFAAVSFSGSTTIGYQFNYEDDWDFLFYGDDGDDTNPISMNLKASDDDGLWSLSVRAGVPGKGATLGDSGSMAGDVTVDITKLFGLDGDFSLSGKLIANSRYTHLRAYSNNSGMNYDRTRTNSGFESVLTFAYSDLVKAEVAADLGFTGATAKGGKAVDDGISTTRDIVASVLVTPVDGVEVSGMYILNGEGGNGAFGGAADINLGSLLDLDFTIGLSIADRYRIDDANTFAATVYGGVDAVDFAVEYALVDETSALWAGVDLNVVEDLAIGLYAGVNDISAIADSYYVGGNIGYSIKSFDFNLGIEYATASNNYNYDLSGLNIVPSVSFSW